MLNVIPPLGTILIDFQTVTRWVARGLSGIVSIWVGRVKSRSVFSKSVNSVFLKNRSNAWPTFYIRR